MPSVSPDPRTALRDLYNKRPRTGHGEFACPCDEARKATDRVLAAIATTRAKINK